MRITDGLHIDPNTYVPAAADVRDLTQRDGEAYEDWQDRLLGDAAKMREKYPVGVRSSGHKAVEISGINNPSDSETFKIPKLKS